jgi:microcystin-dependent protein
MPNTPVYTLPYPASTDPPNVPLDMQELAERIEDILMMMEQHVSTGMLSAIMSMSAPPGWLMCDGDPIPIEHTDLIAMIGPNTPNLKGCAIFGYDPDDTTFDAIGNKGGKKTEELLVKHMPAHDHENLMVGGVVLRRLQSQVQQSGGSTDLIRLGGTDSIVQVKTEGGGQAHNNMPPYFTANIIIKT